MSVVPTLVDPGEEGGVVEAETDRIVFTFGFFFVTCAFSFAFFPGVPTNLAGEVVVDAT